jgi:O-antigen/teichoic acid export membrane protein
LPAVARLQEEPERLRARLMDATRLMTVVSVPVLWGISAIAPELVHVVLGAKWARAVVPVQLLSLIVPLRMIHTIFATAIIGIGHARLNLWSSIVSGTVLPSAFFIGTHWGVNGLAASWLIAVPLSFTLNFWRLDRAFGVRKRDIAMAVWRPVAAGLAMYATVTALRLGLAGIADLARLPVLIAAGAAGYTAVLHLLDPGIRRDLAGLLRAARA